MTKREQESMDEPFKGKKMKCNHCGSEMIDTTTRFTAIRDGAVYVVENVPCLECPVCGHQLFTKSIGKKLEEQCQM